jgi:hypothetical protein
MRKPNPTLDRSATHLLANRDYASRALVCLALVLALTALLGRIASVW